MFTPTEAAAVGAFLAMLLAAVRRTLTLRSLFDALLETVRTSGLIFLILIGATLFSQFIAISRIPGGSGRTPDRPEPAPGRGADPDPRDLHLLGMFMEGFAMMVLMLPVVFPIITALGYDPIWFGIVMVIVLEMGLIDPPVGVNVFVVKGMSPDVPMNDIFIGIVPFWLRDDGDHRDPGARTRDRAAAAELDDPVAGIPSPALRLGVPVTWRVWLAMLVRCMQQPLVPEKTGTPGDPPQSKEPPGFPLARQ